MDQEGTDIKRTQSTRSSQRMPLHMQQ